MEARGLQFGLQGDDAKRQTRRLLEVGQIAVESAGAGTCVVRTAGQVAQQLEIGPMRLSAMRAERCRVYKQIALSWRASWPQGRVYLVCEHPIRLFCHRSSTWLSTRDARARYCHNKWISPRARSSTQKVEAPPAGREKEAKRQREKTHYAGGLIDSSLDAGGYLTKSRRLKLVSKGIG